MSRLRSALATIADDLKATGHPWALLGGLAVSAHVEPRFTRDIEIFDGLVVPVSCPGHLVALKLLARDDAQRPQDLVDLRALIANLDVAEEARARQAVELITARGFHRGRDLGESLDALLAG